MRGWVYVISNPSMPGLVKIGFSMKDPQLRARELEGTGVPTPYKVDFAALVDSPRALEQSLHHHFKMFHHGKEWFRIHPDQLIPELKKVIGDVILYSDSSTTHENAHQNQFTKSGAGQLLMCSICGGKYLLGIQHACDKSFWPHVTCKGCLIKGIKTLLRVPPGRSMIVKCPKCKVKFKARTN